MYTTGAKFHAAVGLAQLADAAGFEWLIAHSADSQARVELAQPAHVPKSSLNTGCVAALRILTGEKSLNTRAGWADWWKAVDRKTLPKDHVEFVGRE